MKNRISLIDALIVGLAIGAVACLSGCSSQGTLNANNIKPAVDLVTERHNAYVQADASLSDAEKQKFQSTANLLKEVVDKAAQPDEVVQ